MTSPLARRSVLFVTTVVLLLTGIGLVVVTPRSPSVAQRESPADSPPVFKKVRKAEASDAARVFVQEQVIGRSIQSRSISRVTLGKGEYRILFLASIHGNEAAGTPLMERLMDELRNQPEFLSDATVVIIPVVNPDGVESNTRFNARGVDLNRNFPAENRVATPRYGLEALSEPEALAIHQTIEGLLPNHIVTLHEPLQCVDYDGPAKELAEAMSRVSPLPVKKLGSRPGSLGAFAGETLGIPTITFELPKNAAEQSPELLWRFYGPALVEAVQFRCRRILAN